MTSTKRAAPWILLVLAALLPFLPALGNGFVYDDQGVVLDNPGVWSPSIAAPWSASYWPGLTDSGLYRPWTLFSFWLNARLNGRHPLGFHALNLLLHLAVSLLLWRVLCALFPDRRAAAYATSLVFAVHPIHVEAIVPVHGRAELWAGLWGLLAYLLALRYAAGRSAAWFLGSAAAYGLALLSKESAAGLLLLPLFHLTPLAPAPPRLTGDPQRQRWRALAASWLVVLALALLVRIRVLGGLVALAHVDEVDNLLAQAPAWSRIPAALGYQWILLERLALPLRLSADYSYPQLQLTAAWMAAGLALLLLGAGALARALRRRDRAALWGFALVLAAGLASANVLLPIGTVLGERLAYLPSAGFLWICIGLVDRWLDRLGTRGRKVVLILGIGWVGFLCARSSLYALDWRSNLALWRAVVRTSPRSPRAWTNLSVALLWADRTVDAEAPAREALRLYPGYPPAAEALGSALARSGRSEEAVPWLRQASRPGPRRAEALLKLGNVWLELKHGEDADSVFRASILLLPASDSRPMVGLASALALQSLWPQSSRAWHNAVARSPGDSDVRRQWAYALWQAGEPDSAEAVYRQIRRESPDDPRVSNDLAWFLVKSGRGPGEAEALARRVYRASPDANNGDTLLESLLANGGCARARAWADSIQTGLAGADSLPMSVVRTLEERCGKFGR